jgi:hypothetical protein
MVNFKSEHFLPLYNLLIGGPLLFSVCYDSIDPHQLTEISSSLDIDTQQIVNSHSPWGVWWQQEGQRKQFHFLI